MLSKAEIESNLLELDKAYNDHPEYGTYFSKLAILELCGWTELCMDEIVRSHASRKNLSQATQTYLENSVIKRTYGFEYDRHFRGMLMRLLGLSDLQSLEEQVDVVAHTKMDAQLNNLRTVRNLLAHTFVQPAMPTLDAPSVTLARLSDLHVGLTEYHVKLQTL